MSQIKSEPNAPPVAENRLDPTMAFLAEIARDAECECHGADSVRCWKCRAGKLLFSGLNISPETLARKFCEEINDRLDVLTLSGVVARNRAEKNPHICHTHDFCDANQLMIDALMALGMPEDAFDPQSEEQTHLINEAWTLAKLVEFRTEMNQAEFFNLPAIKILVEAQKHHGSKTRHHIAATKRIESLLRVVGQ